MFHTWITDNTGEETNEDNVNLLILSTLSDVYIDM